MQYTISYSSPLGRILLAADEIGLTGLWFEGAKYYASTLDPDHEKKYSPVLNDACRWLKIYFSGQIPDFMPPLHITGSPFRLHVWKILQQIPYGKTLTYKDLAKIIAGERQLPHMSAQAVGSAVGHNPVSILIPCHRVIGSNGSLTGYAGGIEKKRSLLVLEGVDMSSVH